jgi:hypothetical protein
LKQDTPSSKLIKLEEDKDLTPYFIDYFLMRLVFYLQWQDDGVKGTLEDQHYEKYSLIVLKAF